MRRKLYDHHCKLGWLLNLEVLSTYEYLDPAESAEIL